jgi:hypothetical protein
MVSSCGKIKQEASGLENTSLGTCLENIYDSVRFMLREPILWLLVCLTVIY